MSFLADKIRNLYLDHHFQIYRKFPLTLLRGEGCRVFDDEDREYIDALGGIAVNSLGHCHPKVVQAITEQAGRLIHVSNLYYNAPQSSLAQLLAEITGYDRVYFCNSGLEASEAALKIARRAASLNGRKGPVVSFTNCFHGRSIATVAMGPEKYRRGFGPMPDGYLQLPYNDVKALDKIPDEAAAVFVECIQGEGGVVPGQPEFLQKLGQLCADKNILLVADEIQCGMGRTGRFFAYEHFGLKPDLVTMAKGLGSGVPIGAVLAREQTAAVLQAGDHGTTFGGNPLACAAAVATLRVIMEDDLVNKAREAGEYLLGALKGIAEGRPEVRDVRGMGLMIGVEFEQPCREIAIKMMQYGVLVSCTADKVIRILPPLVIRKKELDQIVSAFKRVFLYETLAVT